MWPELRKLGKIWENLTKDPSTVGGSDEARQTQLETLLSCMPSLDLWFHAEAGMYRYVSPFLSKLSWDGGLVDIIPPWVSACVPGQQQFFQTVDHAPCRYKL